MGNTVAIVGRPNVGKSTIFNRLIGQKKSIIDNVSGVTRDRTYGESFWNGKEFKVIDTGGFVRGSDDVFEAAIREQVEIAIEEASVILFVVDVTTGITDLDESVATMLRKSNKPIFLMVNKVDNQNRAMEANEFWSMGFESTYFVSSLSGSGTGDLLDEMMEHIDEGEILEEDVPKFAIIGQPNVGKSSLTNALLGQERTIVTDVAGTTRDSIHTKYNKFGKDFYLIDTAGMRKKAKVHENLEYYSVLRTIRSIEEADICILMIDAQEGVQAQDMTIFSMAIKQNKGIVVLVNKWDLVNKETNTARDMEEDIRKKFAPFNDLPIIFVSVKEKQRIFKAIEEAFAVYERRTQKIKTSELNEVMGEAISNAQPPTHRGKIIRINYITQLPVHYPAFAFFCNYPQHVKESYKNYLENQLRLNYDFRGVPISVFFRAKN